LINRKKITGQERNVYEQLISSYKNKIILIYSKSDCTSANNDIFLIDNHLYVSSTQHTNIALLETRILNKIENLIKNADVPFLLNHRQCIAIIELEKKLIAIKKILARPVAYELLSYHLNDALVHLSSLTGKTISEQSMDTIFRQFCIGK